MPTTDQLLVNLILYGLLPLWGITGFIDWCCHRATRIEHTSGLRES
ncbi:MAG TPA: diguanylate cyclase, partial [Gammaproteobacteria bacterium]|nr:diguanylate cyclase [Gammaproteobacteria bacterium]